jgi:hypothetical protein
MKTKYLLTILVACVLTACKKDYVCGCSYLGGVDYHTETYHDIKYNAKKKCNELSKKAPEEASCKLK